MMVAPWTKEEIARLRKLVPVSTRAELAIAFAPRSISSVIIKALRLKLHPRPMYRDWRAICNAHKPRIVLAQVVVREVTAR